MGFFNTILGAIKNPEQQASDEQLGTIFTSIAQVSRSFQTDPANVETAMSVVGKYAKAALREQRNADGEEAAQRLVNDYAGTQPSPDAVRSLFSMSRLQHLSEEVERKTGINQGIVQAMLPVLVPLVLNFLKTGTHARNPLSPNPVLRHFLDTDADGDVDITDALAMASRRLQR